jgi:hypothetical protein
MPKIEEIITAEFKRNLPLLMRALLGKSKKPFINLRTTLAIIKPIDSLRRRIYSKEHPERAREKKISKIQHNRDFFLASFRFKRMLSVVCADSAQRRFQRSLSGTSAKRGGIP